MDLIFMLTHEDRTVPGCLEVLEQIAPLGLSHVGFKDVGADRATLTALSGRIAALGATSYLEVVSTDRKGCLAAARAAAELGVHKVMGGTDAGAMLSILRPAGVSLLPFPGRPEGHPTKLGGDPRLVEDHCRAFAAQGCAGADLLAYRATQADPVDLVRAARRGLGQAELVVAGSVVDAWEEGRGGAARGPPRRRALARVQRPVAQALLPVGGRIGLGARRRRTPSE